MRVAKTGMLRRWGLEKVAKLMPTDLSSHFATSKKEAPHREKFIESKIEKQFA